MTATRSLLPLCLLIAIMAGCKHELKNVVSHDVNPQKVPTMVSRDVAQPPHWIFPDGVLAEEVDKKFKPISTIRCDSAYYNELTKVWSLNGNVRITNVENEVILTNHMFWDQDKHKLYSDSFIHIERASRVIEGYGYESNEDFTTYKINKVMAIFPIDENRFPRGG